MDETIQNFMSHAKPGPPIKKVFNIMRRYWIVRSTISRIGLIRRPLGRSVRTRLGERFTSPPTPSPLDTFLDPLAEVSEKRRQKHIP